MRCHGHDVERTAGGGALRVLRCGVGVLGVMCAVLGPLRSASVSATTVVEQDLPTLCNEANMAFVGTVTRTSSRWADAEQRRMETLVTFAQIVPLLGDPGEEITLRFPGGEIDGIREEVAGLPRFRIGDRAVLLVRGDGGVSPIVGFHQGFFPVVDGPDGPMVSNLAQRLMSSGTGGSVDAESTAVPRDESIPLETFLNVLRAEFERKQEER
jgi:hypothetical protein